MSAKSSQATSYFQLLTSIFSFSNSYDIAISTILIVIIIAVVIFIFKQFAKRKNLYYSQEYWESRYLVFPKYMDWYCNFEKLCNDFKIDNLLAKYYPNKKKTKIIELGCGNSCLAIDLSKLAYKNITSIDFSNTVIKQMKKKFIGEGVNFVCGDFLKMNELFQENSFDLVIEKAGLDSIATKDSPDVPNNLRNIFNQIYVILKPGGNVFSFSIKNPEFWHQNVYEHLVKLKMFKVVQQMCTVFSTEKNPTLMNLYFYQLTSLKT